MRGPEGACHCFGFGLGPAVHALSRHSLATHLLEVGFDLRTAQELLGPREVISPMIYAHALNRGGRGVPSPADDL